MRLSERLRRTKHQRREEIRELTTLDHPLQTTTIELKVKNAPEHGLRIAVIPDAQVRDDVPIDHLVAAGQYIADKRPEVIVCIGDWADMPSLSDHEKPGHLELENKRYRLDLDAAHAAMEAFLAPISKASGYEPMMVLTLGNHEDRITRSVKANPNQLAGLISVRDLRYKEYGWNVIPFLQPVVIGGVAFCHYFPSGVMGRPITSARQLLTKLHMSAYAGHQQGRDLAFAKRADGSDIGAIISGSFYQHDESYLSPFTNRHWRGMYFLHEVRDGVFAEMALGIDFLLRRLARKRGP